MGSEELYQRSGRSLPSRRCSLGLHLLLLSSCAVAFQPSGSGLWRRRERFRRSQGVHSPSLGTGGTLPFLQSQTALQRRSVGTRSVLLQKAAAAAREETEGETQQGQIRVCRVTRVLPDFLFAALPDGGNGFLHKAEVSDGDEALTDQFSPGQEVRVRVIGYNEEKQNWRLSVKKISDPWRGPRPGGRGPGPRRDRPEGLNGMERERPLAPVRGKVRASTSCTWKAGESLLPGHLEESFASGLSEATHKLISSGKLPDFGELVEGKVASVDGNVAIIRLSKYPKLRGILPDRTLEPPNFKQTPPSVSGLQEDAPVSLHVFDLRPSTFDKNKPIECLLSAFPVRRQSPFPKERGEVYNVTVGGIDGGETGKVFFDDGQSVSITGRNLKPKGLEGMDFYQGRAMARLYPGKRLGALCLSDSRGPSDPPPRITLDPLVLSCHDPRKKQNFFIERGDILVGCRVAAVAESGVYVMLPNGFFSFISSKYAPPAYRDTRLSFVVSPGEEIDVVVERIARDPETNLPKYALRWVDMDRVKAKKFERAAERAKARAAGKKIENEDVYAERYNIIKKMEADRFGREDIDDDTKRERAGKRAKEEMWERYKEDPRNPVYFPPGVNPTVEQLREAIRGRATLSDIVKHLMMEEGVMATAKNEVDRAVAKRVAKAFGRGWTEEDPLAGFFEGDEDGDEEGGVGRRRKRSDDEEGAMPRPPCVTIMGHVDHGKTSLLDAIRKAKVASGEVGGITQSIGAYMVDTAEETKAKGGGKDKKKKDKKKKKGKKAGEDAKAEASGGKSTKITFIDTPGHAAFKEMRGRGANVTDVVVLVVAADDGVMEQTVESIKMIRAAEVPVIVAVNKIDKPTTDIPKLLGELASYDVLTEDLGGDVQCARVSAVTKEGIDELLEKILLEAEVREFKANPEKPARGFILETEKRQGLGQVATVLVQTGTLNVGDHFHAGSTYGKVKALKDWNEKPTKTATPSVPVLVTGFASGEAPPLAGDELVVVPSLAEAKQAAEEFSRTEVSLTEKLLAIGAGDSGTTSVQASMSNQFKGTKTLTLVVKADNLGSAEALARSLGRLSLQDDKGSAAVKLLNIGTGEVIKADIDRAQVEGGMIVAFDVEVTPEMEAQAMAAGVPIFKCNIIYNAIEDVELRLARLLTPAPPGRYAGGAVVRAVFASAKGKKAAGCAVSDGILRKGANCRVMRGREVLHMGKIKEIRKVKDLVTTIEKGSECGILLEDYDEMEEGDVIECFIESVSEQKAREALEGGQKATVVDASR